MPRVVSEGHPNPEDELLFHADDGHFEAAPDEVMLAVDGAEIRGKDRSRFPLLGRQPEPAIRSRIRRIGGFCLNGD